MIFFSFSVQHRSFRFWFRIIFLNNVVVSLTSKIKFFECFVKFQKQVEKQFQSDGGDKFNSLALKNHLTRHGIMYQMSCSGTPDQNGVAKGNTDM